MVLEYLNFLQSWVDRHVLYPHEKIPARPMNVILCLESACNLHCIQCDIWRTRVAKPQMTLEQRKKIIHKLRKWLGPFTLNFFAGEPLLHPQTFELIKYATQLGVKSIITTNGTMLSETIAKKLIEIGLHGMFISLDGVTKETHDRIRGVAGTYERVLSGINRMVKMRKNKQPKIIIETLLMNKNLHEIIKMTDFIKKLGIDGHVFQPVTSKYGFGSDVYNPLWHKEKENLLPAYNEIIPILKEIVRRKQKGYSILNTYDHLEKTVAYFRNPDFFVRDVLCNAHQNFAITDSGDILFCFSQKSVGNYQDTNYNLVWRGKLADEVRRENRYCDKTSKIILCYSTDLGQLFDSLPTS